MQQVDLPLQRGDKAGFVVAAAVELLLQPLVCLGVGGVLLTRGDEGGNAPLQLGVLLHGQRVLPDEGTAFKYLTRHAQQHLTRILRGDARHGRGGAGVGAGELAHRRGGAACLAQQGVALAARSDVHAAAQRCAAPRRIAVLVRHGAALAGGQAVQHGADERAPCGLAGFVRRVQQIQAGRER